MTRTPGSPDLEAAAAEGGGREPPATADLGAADPSTLASAMELFAPLARYHRLEVRGLDRIKPGPALFVANHSGGLNPVDALFLFRYYEQRGYDDPIYVLGHDLLFEVPRFARTLRAIGALRAAPQQAQEILRAGRKLLVFPGGDLDNMRAFRHRREVVFGGRTGFVRLAREGGAPIVPVVSAGTHETFVVLTQGRRLARMMRLPERLRVNSCPVALAAPWGVVWGPGILLPYLPLPAKVTVEVGEPSSVDELSFQARDDAAVAELVRTGMQATLERLYEERRFPVLG